MWEGDFMGLRSFVLVLASLPAIVQAQSALPPDINPVTLSRLPPASPDDLDEEGRKLLASRPEVKPGPGPTHVTNYSPRERSLGIPSGVNSPVARAIFSSRSSSSPERSTSSTSGLPTSLQDRGRDSSSRSSTSSNTTRTSQASPTRMPRSSHLDARCIASTA